MSQKILVVEDELFMLRLIQHTLAKAGYDLIEARSSEEARAAIATERPSIVVGDARVVENSLRTGQNYNDTAKRPASIPVICVSDEPRTSEKKHQADGEIVFTKPFSPMKLIAEVKRLSAHAETTQRAAGGNL